MTDEKVGLPQYQPPTGTPRADSKQSATLGKVISRMLNPKLKGLPKGIMSKQNVKIGHKGRSKKTDVKYW